MISRQDVSGFLAGCLASSVRVRPCPQVRPPTARRDARFGWGLTYRTHRSRAVQLPGRWGETEATVYHDCCPGKRAGSAVGARRFRSNLLVPWSSLTRPPDVSGGRVNDSCLHIGRRLAGVVKFAKVARAQQEGRLPAGAGAGRRVSRRESSPSHCVPQHTGVGPEETLRRLSMATARSPQLPVRRFRTVPIASITDALQGMTVSRDQGGVICELLSSTSKKRCPKYTCRDC